MKFDKKKLLIILFGLLVLSYLVFIIINDKGVLTYLKLKSELSTVNENVVKTEAKITDLKKEIDSLKTSDVKLEKVAREKYNMKSSDEEAFKVIEK